LRLLLIEDEVRLAANIGAALREAGFAVDHAADGVDGSLLAEQDVFDLIVLDLMLPGKSGEQVLRGLRAAGRSTPWLVLTAQHGKDWVVQLLNAGADDYLSKPFDLSELVARVHALIRRSKGGASPTMRVGNLEIDPLQQVVRRDGKNIDLSPTEFMMLEYLAHRPRAVVSKQELLDHIHDFDWDHHSNVIEVHLSRLRRKLDVPGEESIVETLRHRGYRLRVRGA